jgi:cellulose synthase operon protein C
VTAFDPPGGGSRSPLQHVAALLETGACLQAYHAAEPLGALRGWPGPAGQVLAGRLASQLGGGRSGDALLLRALRRWPDDAGAVMYGAMALNGTRGPLAAIELIEGKRDTLAADARIQGECTAFLAYLYAYLRDFEAAEALIAPLAANPVSAWILAQLAAINELKDDYEGALAAARRGLELNPDSRSAIQYVARFLSLQERDAEAIELLRDALKRVESARIAGQLTNLEIETRQPEAALATLDRYDQLTPLKDKWTRTWLAGRRCDVHSELGDIARAIEEARRSGSPFYTHIAEQLEKAGTHDRRVMLQVGFVRQHHMTCAPATLSALSRYWERAAHHLELAEEICYDGTPHHSELRWARHNGWYPRDFTVTWESARGLIDAGLPFTLTTVQPDSAHLQAVIGYDARRGTLLIRDPYERTHGEFAQAPFFESSAANGPRGMALVPAERRAALDAIVLPDAELHDLADEVQGALARHVREQALAACAALEQRSPGHRLAIHARRSIAIYDNDEPAILAGTEALLAVYPKDTLYRLWKAGSLRVLAPRAEYLAWLQRMAEEPGSHTVARLRYAQVLLEDDRRRLRATKLLRRILAHSPRNAEALSALADAHWQGCDYARAVPCYRFAATVEETDEGYAMSYFRAASAVRGQESAIDFLRARWARLGSRSPQPAITLYRALEELERTEAALAVLEDALTRHPEDAGLLLFAARALPAVGQRERARQLLERARDGSKKTQWLQAANQIAQGEGRLTDALGFILEAVGIEPLNLDLQRTCVRLKHETQGRDAAVAHLRAAVERFPHHMGLNELLIEWLDQEEPEKREAALRRLLDINPINAWAHRELALVLGWQQRFEEARAALEAARVLDPNAIGLHNISGRLHVMEGKQVEARADFRRALQLSADNNFALRNVIECCSTLEERRAEFAFIAHELKRQVLQGDGLLTFQSLAGETLEPQAVLDILDEAHAIRPDLWQAWIARVRQLMDMQQGGRARELCDQARARFPHLPRVHVERAEILRQSDDRRGEREALAEALRLSPGWALAARRLANSLEATGDIAALREVVERALLHSPSEGVLHGYLGDALWQLGERKESLAPLERAVGLDPEYDWAWDTLKARAAELGEPQRAYEAARRLTLERPGDARGWRALANVADDAEERLRALDRAIAAAPFEQGAHAAKTDLLIELGRYDDAIAAVAGTRWGAKPPVRLAVGAARAHHAKGEKKTAIAAVESALAADPNSYMAWEQLANWRREAEDHAGYLEAARHLHRLAPNNPHALGHLADAQHAADPRADVRELLRRAVLLKPDYTFAAFALFDREVEAGALQAAEGVLEAVAVHTQSRGLRLRRFRLAAARADSDQIRARFAELIAHDADSSTVDEALAALGKRKKWLRLCERVIDEAALSPSANAGIGTLWVQRRARRRWYLWPYRGLGRVLANPACQHAVAEEFVRQLAKRKSGLRVRWFIARHATLLAANDDTHGVAGYALVECNETRAALAWFRRFPPRDSTPAWALLNVANAYREFGHDKQAADWNRTALERPVDHTISKHHASIALDAARAAQTELARQHLQKAAEGDLGNYYEFCCCLARALLAAVEGSRERGLENGLQELRRAKSLLPLFTEDAVLKRVTREAVRKLARAGTSSAPLAWLRMLKLWLSF